MNKLLIFIIIIIYIFNWSISSGEENVAKEQIDELSAKIIKSFPVQPDEQHKKRIAISEFQDLSENAKKQNIGRGIAEILTTNLVQSKLFIVVERMQLKKVLEEMSLALTGLVDPSTAKEVGKILGADAILTGSVSEIGGFYTINARVIDVETATLLTTAAVDIKREFLTQEISKYIVIMEEKSPMQALLYSSILPGFGQFYNNQPTKAIIIESLEVISLASAIYFYIKGNSKYSDYENAMSTNDAVKFYDESQNNYKISLYSQIAFLSVWFYNVIDAYWIASLIGEEKELKKETKYNQFEIKIKEVRKNEFIPVFVYTKRF